MFAGGFNFNIDREAGAFEYLSERSFEAEDKQLRQTRLFLCAFSTFVHGSRCNQCQLIGT